MSSQNMNPGIVARVPIYLIPHGEKFSNVPNPGMTPLGFKQIGSLIEIVPFLNRCIVGTGQRHIDVLKALNGEPCFFTPVVGGPDSLEKDTSGKKVVLLTDGTPIPYEQYSLDGMDAAAAKLINSIDKPTSICCGRPLLISLGVEDGKSASVYLLNGNEIELLKTYGDIGAGKQEV